MSERNVDDDKADDQAIVAAPKLPCKDIRNFFTKFDSSKDVTQHQIDPLVVSRRVVTADLHPECGNPGLVSDVTDAKPTQKSRSLKGKEPKRGSKQRRITDDDLIIECVKDLDGIDAVCDKSKSCISHAVSASEASSGGKSSCEGLQPTLKEPSTMVLSESNTTELSRRSAAQTSLMTFLKKKVHRIRKYRQLQSPIKNEDE